MAKKPKRETQAEKPKRPDNLSGRAADFEAVAEMALDAGCEPDQIKRFLTSGFIPQEKQWQFCAAARECDQADGPTAVLTGGARGGGKSVIVLAQVGTDDCQRFPGLKALWLRKVSSANVEHLGDMRMNVFKNVPNKYTQDGVIRFPNGSRIVAGHFKNENDIDKYIGVEYDLIATEEATTISANKRTLIRGSLRSSKAGWRPREYLTTNPGGVNHAGIFREFIQPWRAGKQIETRFVPSKCSDNAFNNPEYLKILQSLPPGWRRRAWLDGDWDIAAGQFFVNWREDKHVIDDWHDDRAMSWMLAMDYGFRHWCVWLLGAMTGDGQMVIVEEIASREQTPAYFNPAVRDMLARHSLTWEKLDYAVAGADIFATESDGNSVAGEYAGMGMPLVAAEMDRVNGWAAITHRLGDPEKDRFPPKLVIHRQCKKLIETMPTLCHSETKPEDVEKVDCDSDTGEGGDDAADCLRYIVASYRASGLSYAGVPCEPLYGRLHCA